MARSAERAKEIGCRLRELRGIKTRTGVAKELGISYSCLSNYEANGRIPNDEMKVKLANYYGTTVQALFYD